jgi:hypothetical protein
MNINYDYCSYYCVNWRHHNVCVCVYVYVCVYIMFMACYNIIAAKILVSVVGIIINTNVLNN